MMARSRLAVDSYALLGCLDDSTELLNLAWTRDERAWLACDLDELMAECLRAEMHQGLPRLNSYPVQDPYGEAAPGKSVRKALRIDATVSIFAGAGAGALVQAMAGMARWRPLVVAGDVYPDFPYWVEQAVGIQVKALCDDLAPGGAVFLEHPGLTARSESLEFISGLCERARSADGLVVVDESNANYLPPDQSSAGLLCGHDNLIVIRGMSKAYGLGGLRLGFALCNPVLAPLLRRLITPLQVSPLALEIGAAILSLGDIAAPLRARIRHVRERAEAIIAGLPLPSRVSVDPRLPYLLFDGAAPDAIRFFEARRVRGKVHRYWSAAEGMPASYYRVSLPLSEDRMLRFQAYLSG